MTVDNRIGETTTTQAPYYASPIPIIISKKNARVYKRALFLRKQLPPPTAGTIADIIDLIVSQGGDSCPLATIVTRHALWLRIMSSLKSQINRNRTHLSITSFVQSNLVSRNVRKLKRHSYTNTKVHSRSVGTTGLVSSRQMCCPRDSLHHSHQFSPSPKEKKLITQKRMSGNCNVVDDVRGDSVEPISVDYVWDDIPYSPDTPNTCPTTSHQSSVAAYINPGAKLTLEQIENHIEKLRLDTKQRKFKRYANLMQKLMDHPKNHKGIFNHPVDPIAQNLPTYTAIVKNPMDLGTVKAKLENGQYHDATSFAADICLVFSNAMLFNPPNHYVHMAASHLKVFFEEQFHQATVRMQNEQTEDGSEHNCGMCSGSICVLCLDKCLEFSIPPLTCSGPCGLSVRRGSTYYQTRDGTRVWCSRCYSKSCRGKRKLEHISSKATHVEPTLMDLKGELMRDRCEVEVEPWIQCSQCNCWMHQICALYNSVAVDLIGCNEEFICMLCRKEKLVSSPSPSGMVIEQVQPRPSYTADDLPQSPMGRFIECSVRNELKALGEEDVAESLCIRVVSAVEKIQSVPLVMQQAFSQNTESETYPLEIPYQSKAIYMFQKHDGIDLCLFAMYVQEYDADCPSLSNRRTVYVAYLDSVQYLQPPRLRTLVYHQILVAYLDFARLNGFTKAHIWSCPPQRSVSYVFWCHPKHQRTPGVEHLRTWYTKMLSLALKKGVITGWSTFYDRYFAPGDDTGKNLGPACVTRRNSVVDVKKSSKWPCLQIPPCFDGDYWPAEAERIILKKMNSNIAKKAKENKALKLNLASTPSDNSSGDGSEKMVLLYDVFKSALSSIKLVKDDLLVVDLNVPSDAVNEMTGDDKMEAFRFVETRHAFHQLCASDCYQFDSLRRAKHSTMMLLQHLFNSHLPLQHYFCDSCGYLITSEHFWHCKSCDAFALCDWCKKTSRHCHELEFGGK